MQTGAFAGTVAITPMVVEVEAAVVELEEVLVVLELSSASTTFMAF